MKPILITVALKSELEYLVSKMENVIESKLGIYNYYEGTINGYPVCLIKTEIGIINASSSTTLAIQKCNPAIILNEGTAGGITPNHHKKDIIIAENVFNIMSCRTPYKEIGEGSNSLEWEYISFIDGGKDEIKIYNADQGLVKFFYNLKDRYTEGTVYLGTVGSGDAWNREKDKLRFLNEQYNVSAEDMEAVAVYNVAKNFNIPVLGIKVMSDNEILGEEYEPEVAQYLQEFFYNALLELINKMKEE